ncbi:MAG: tRNA 2-thiocytidine(32) synthetase TtcA [Leptospiraceae bacterium]|nr:tRNA 2-thiocytidine(32) synthetase TtcA [Leptospiraceae bacterium]MDW8306626.1 tRNA 2-thiocytidine(32) synthetase TtcA [Leptospiraceae bacterium]
MTAEGKKRYKKILHQVGKTIEEYGLIENNDRILVAVSGGKDSLSLLYILNDLQKKAPLRFEIFAYTLDQGQGDFAREKLEEFYQKLGVEYYIEFRDTYSIVRSKIPPGKTYCSLCSRLRRGILYSEAERLGANKIALGHHADDAIETLFLNLFFNGRLAAIPPKLKAMGGRHIVIRPLIACDEEDFVFLSREMNFPVLPCQLCGLQENLHRQQMKRLLAEFKRKNPVVSGSLKKAIANVQPSHLWDKNLYKMDSVAPIAEDL